jgi:hypothetical protein
MGKTTKTYRLFDEVSELSAPAHHTAQVIGRPNRFRLTPPAVKITPVSPKMISPRHNEPDCIEAMV